MSFLLYAHFKIQINWECDFWKAPRGAFSLHAWQDLENKMYVLQQLNILRLNQTTHICGWRIDRRIIYLEFMLQNGHSL